MGIVVIVIIIIIIIIIIVIILLIIIIIINVFHCFQNVACSLVSASLRPISLPTLHPTNIACLRLSGKSPTGLGIPPLKFKIMLESNPPKSTMIVGRLGVNSSNIYIYIYNVCMYVYIYIYLCVYIYIYIERER